MTTVEALKNLYVQLGGKATDVANINLNPAAVKAIADLVAAGALSSLPEIGNHGVGKVLTVVEKNKEKVAAWAWNPGSQIPEIHEGDIGSVFAIENDGEDNPEVVFIPREFVIGFSGTDADHDAACDKTWAQIVADFATHAPVKVRYHQGTVWDGAPDADEYVVLQYAYIVQNNSMVSVIGMGLIGNAETVVCSIDNAGSVSVVKTSLTSR